MYFDLLKTILEPKCAYEIYLDIKDTQGQAKVEKLQQCLCNCKSDFDKKILRKFSKSDLMKLSLRAVCYVHRGLETSSAKMKLIAQIRKRSGYSLLENTLYKENKMNIFVWKGKVL